MWLMIFSFIIVIVLVVYILWFKIKGDDFKSLKGYFFVGWGLGGLVIGCLMVLILFFIE